MEGTVMQFQTFELRKFPVHPRSLYLFIGMGDMSMLNGRDIIARDFWCFEELLFHQDGSQTWWRVCGG
jgi:hypothetical protein